MGCLASWVLGNHAGFPCKGVLVLKIELVKAKVYCGWINLEVHVGSISISFCQLYYNIVS